MRGYNIVTTTEAWDTHQPRPSPSSSFPSHHFTKGSSVLCRDETGGCTGAQGAGHTVQNFMSMELRVGMGVWRMRVQNECGGCGGGAA